MLTKPARYRLRVQGQLGPQWADWFAGFTMSWEVPGETVLVGQVVDQAALYGLLNTLRDLGLPLLEVLHLPPEESGAADP
jgi:hypothetical protein